MPHSEDPSSVKLLADAMLGRLAKWLRVLGYDTAYLADTDDFAVMRLARAEGRLILTCDHALAGRPGVDALFIESSNLEEQLRQVRRQVGPPERAPFSRCPACNTALIEADLATIASRVPPYVQRTQNRFAFCSACDRVYWPGTHWERMQALVSEVDGLQNLPDSDKIAPSSE